MCMAFKKLYGHNNITLLAFIKLILRILHTQIKYKPSKADICASLTQHFHTIRTCAHSNQVLYTGHKDANMNYTRLTLQKNICCRMSQFESLMYWFKWLQLPYCHFADVENVVHSTSMVDRVSIHMSKPIDILYSSWKYLEKLMISNRAIWLPLDKFGDI